MPEACELPKSPIYHTHSNVFGLVSFSRLKSKVESCRRAKSVPVRSNGSRHIGMELLKQAKKERLNMD